MCFTFLIMVRRAYFFPKVPYVCNPNIASKHIYLLWLGSLRWMVFYHETDISAVILIVIYTHTHTAGPC